MFFVSVGVVSGVANATPTQWSASFAGPAWDTEYSLDLTSLAPNYLPGVDSLSSALLSLDYSNSGNGNTGTATFEVFVNEVITGTVAFTKASENVQLPLPATTLADLSTNGRIDFFFHRTGTHDFNVETATFVLTGDHDPQCAPVPEPGTLLLLGIGFLGLAVYGKIRKTA